MASHRGQSVLDAVQGAIEASHRAHGQLNAADLDRIRWSLAAFSCHLTEWVSLEAKKAGRLGELGAVAISADPVKTCAAICQTEQVELNAGSQNQIVGTIPAAVAANASESFDVAMLVVRALNACRNLAAESLIAQREELLRAGSQLLALQSEAVWGSAAVAPLAEQNADGKLDIQLHWIDIDVVGRVMAACEAARRQSTTSSQATGPGGSGSRSRAAPESGWLTADSGPVRAWVYSSSVPAATSRQSCSAGKRSGEGLA